MQNETIVDRVVQRLKTQPLGDLITEEDLHDVVKQAIPKTFFEERKVADGSYHTKTLPPIIVETMRDLLKESARDAVGAWIKENPETLASYWKTVCDEGLLKYVQAIQNDKATESLRDALRPWVNKINEERMKMGMPTITTFF